MTLTDREFQRLRNAARAVMTEIAWRPAIERAVRVNPETAASSSSR